MFVRETSPGTFELVNETAAIVVGGTTWPPAIFWLWTEAQLEDAGVWTVVPFVAPEGQQATGERRFERQDDGKVHEVFDLTPAMPPVPASVTRRQMILALYQGGLISGDEAIAAATTGAQPQVIQAYFAGLSSEAERVAANVTWAAMSVCERSNPILLAVAQQHGLSESDLDDYFRMAASL